MDTQYVLWIDGVGGYLICLSHRVTLGQAGANPSPDIAILADVSRHHATIEVAHGRVRFAERSSSGTFISMRPGEEMLVRREDVLLIGSGTISLGMQGTSNDAQLVHFEIFMA